MTHTLTLAQVRAALRGAGEPFEERALPDGGTILISPRGARILGPFLPGEDGAALCWLNPALADADSLRAFLARGEWNLGGERVWIAPEIQFNIRDRRDFWGTHHVPPQMDPGHYTLEPGPGGDVTLTASLTLPAYNLAQGDLALHAAHHITTAVRQPLHTLAGAEPLLEGLAYAGYRRTVRLMRLPERAPGITAEAWCLMQLPPGGLLIIPVSGGLLEQAIYFGDPAPDALTVTDGALRIRLTGQRQYKLGYKAATMTGRMAYWQELPNGESSLLVRAFDNDPSAAYAEEPPDQPGVNGFSVHVYNDGGQFGGNGEMEANGRPLADGGPDSDHFTLWCFRGPAERLRRIGALLLGVGL